MSVEDRFKFLLKIEDLKWYEQRRNFFERPRLTGLYNVDYDKFYPSDTIKYHLKSKNQIVYPLDLNGTSEFSLKYRTQKHFYHGLMHTIFGGTSMFAKEKEEHAGDIELTNVYSRHGVLENIMEFCYGKLYFNVLVSRCNGQLFIIKELEKEEEFDRSQVVFHHMRLSELVFRDSQSAVEDGRKEYDDNRFQILTHKTSLGRYNLHYVGRTQGILANGQDCMKINDLRTLNNQRFVAVKQMWAEMKGNEQRLLKYWLQGYLSNIKDLFIAYKDSDGIVREPMEHFRLCDIPKKCSWKPNVCTVFLLSFLNKVERLMQNVDSLDTVYKFSFNGKHKTVFYKIYEGKSEYSFIPNEYADFIKERF
ncbi:uncharacterized protein LOC142222201 [Haematobia irritans]|uniref:uncharacterized protein LOC142222201 n=1 Tax=Haematobia irritans TaxID=7368 RepID=UPI003F501A58